MKVMKFSKGIFFAGSIIELMDYFARIENKNITVYDYIISCLKKELS
ncbi:MAG: hypothetical protein ACOZCL_12570 [Bacillota bacterium]